MPGDNITPAGDTPPDFLEKGPPGFEKLNDWFRYFLSMVYLPGDASMRVVPGTDVSPGRMYATGTGGTSTSMPTTPPLTVVRADAKDKTGTAHPGRVRVYNGFIALYPQEMTIPDDVMPDGTDNHCYLTMQTGMNYIYGKVLVDAGTGLYTLANVYSVTSPEDADGTYAYLPIANVNFDGGTTFDIEQIATGNKSLRVVFSADGSMISPEWLPLQP